MPGTWDWADFNSWRQTVLELMADVLTPQVFAAFRADSPEFVVSDELDWLDRLIVEHTDQAVSSRHLLVERLTRRFDAMRAYHGARPADPDRYRVEGLRVLDPAAKRAELAACFVRLGLEVEPDVLDVATARVGEDLREGRVFFEANLEHLLRYCGHYLLYGSEYLNAIAVHISERHRDALRRVGTPTVFVCDVPFALLDQHQIEDYAGSVLQSLFLAQLPEPFVHAGPFTASGLMLRQDLPAECIVDHFHPPRVFDPYLNRWEKVVGNQSRRSTEVSQ